MTTLRHPAADLFPTCDIFCRVIDNFGDAGVCWRLARRLLALGVGAVRFITDNPKVLTLLAPEAKAMMTVCAWDDFEKSALEATFVPAELVLETFGCRLPESYEQALAKKRAEALTQKRRPPFYFNLDYLSAEDWVEDSHNIVGLHPTLDLPKVWFFPGFTAKTGGVIIEEGYLDAQATFLTSARKAYLEALGADPARKTLFVFCYPVNALEKLVEGIVRSGNSWNVLLAPGAAGDTIEAALKAKVASDSALAEKLLLIRTPFVPQTAFDQLLWSCDVAVIRGEDSFVRAQLAALPLLWSTYPTEDHAHRIKLDAWLARFTPTCGALGAQYTTWSDGWLEGTITPEEMAEFLDRAVELKPSFAAWRQALFAHGDLATAMLNRAALG